MSLKMQAEFARLREEVASLRAKLEKLEAQLEIGAKPAKAGRG
jgi:BMFP domain-containing protein YqiC